MSQDEFRKLFKYLQEMRSEMNDRFEQTASKEQMDRLTSTVDGLVKLVTDYHQEVLALSHKVDRLER